MNELAPTTNAISRQASTDDQVIALWIKDRSPATVRAYTLDVSRFRVAVPHVLREVTLGDLQAYADELAAAELSTASRARMLATVKSLFSFAHKIGYLPFDVARAVRLPKIEGKLAERILSEGQVLKLLGEAHEGESGTDRRNRVMVLLMYAAGLRVAEICSLEWRHCVERDGGAGQVTVFGKGSKTRSVHLPAGVWAELVDLRGDAADGEPVFRSRERGADGKNRPIDASQANRIVHATAKASGVEKGGRKVSPHWLRHAHASHSIERGAPIHLVQATLGHASISTTGKYLHARPGESSSRYLPVG
ncbi:MAG: integrase family protein [Phycisphaerales bacterium]|nr:integrase family protein [Phycisphaerales bacterium]